jgi:hypothetical protein
MAANHIACPPIDSSLIRYLETVFPDRCVDPRDKDPAISFGNAQVIRHLRAVQLEQEEIEYVSTES